MSDVSCIFCVLQTVWLLLAKLSTHYYSTKVYNFLPVKCHLVSQVSFDNKPISKFSSRTI